MNAEVYFGLGSNIGDRVRQMQDAVVGLQGFVDINQVSPVYETTPWGPVQDQPLFLNACLQGTTSLGAEELLLAVKQLERELGREMGQKWGPHSIDIDLLFYDDLVAEIGARHIPHVQIRQRPFVLYPLADIAPDFVHPVHQQTIADLRAETSPEGVQRYPASIAPLKFTDPDV